MHVPKRVCHGNVHNGCPMALVGGHENLISAKWCRTHRKTDVVIVVGDELRKSLIFLYEAFFTRLDVDAIKIMKFRITIIDLIDGPISLDFCQTKVWTPDQ